MGNYLKTCILDKLDRKSRNESKVCKHAFANLNHDLAVNFCIKIYACIEMILNIDVNPYYLQIYKYNNMKKEQHISNIKIHFLRKHNNIQNNVSTYLLISNYVQIRSYQYLAILDRILYLPEVAVNQPESNQALIYIDRGLIWDAI